MGSRGTGDVPQGRHPSLQQPSKGTDTIHPSQDNGNVFPIWFLSLRSVDKKQLQTTSSFWTFVTCSLGKSPVMALNTPSWREDSNKMGLPRSASESAAPLRLDHRMPVTGPVLTLPVWGVA